MDLEFIFSFSEFGWGKQKKNSFERVGRGDFVYGLMPISNTIRMPSDKLSNKHTNTHTHTQTRTRTHTHTHTHTHAHTHTHTHIYIHIHIHIYIHIHIHIHIHIQTGISINPETHTVTPEHSQICSHYACICRCM